MYLYDLDYFNLNAMALIYQMSIETGADPGVVSQLCYLLQHHSLLCEILTQQIYDRNLSVNSNT